MNYTDMKIYFYNTFAFALSMTEIEIWLKIILLICTIIYTIQKTKKL
jgi:hypothetical protein